MPSRRKKKPGINGPDPPRTTRTVKAVRWFIAVLCLATVAGQAAPPAWTMPEAADMISLSWVDGPPVLQGWLPEDKHLAVYRDEGSLLAFNSGRWGMLLDPRKIRIDRLRLPDNSNAGGAPDLATIMAEWAPSVLDLRAVVDGKVYRPAGGPIDPKNNVLLPVRIVESGDWFQHVAIYDLELRDETGAKLEAVSRLEIRAWGDRCVFEWFVERPDGEATELTARLGVSGTDKNRISASKGKSVRLGVRFDGGELLAGGEGEDGIAISAKALDDFTPGKPSASYSPTSDAWEIRIPKQTGWPLDQGPTDDIPLYAPDLLDRISRFALQLENNSDQPRDVRLRFVHDYHPISGYVPMMLGAGGEQTGLPLQSSKNWHVTPGTPMPYDNAWIRVSTRLRLAPKTKIDLRYDTVHAQWHGVPASSAAQLSLIGWGFNGFWVQMALGSWGETLCIQPGRTMRRSFITDVRPFMIFGPSGQPYDWTPNFGGGDIAKIIGSDGKLLMWRGAVTTYPMIGPELSRVRVRERSADGALRLGIETFLPRSNSATRSYFRVRLEALRDTEFKECALFQLGADYYNDVDAAGIAWGAGESMTGQKNPEGKKGERAMEPVALKGTAPWAALCTEGSAGAPPAAPVRGMIVREYRAVLGGKEDRTPYLAASRGPIGAAKRGALNAELVLPPGISRLQKGDRVEFLVEMIFFPPNEAAYYGPSAGMKKRLGATPGGWELVAHEAARQSVSVDGTARVFPTEIEVPDDLDLRFTAESRSEMDTIVLTGLPDPSGWNIGELRDGKYEPLGKRFPEEAGPQLNYDPAAGTWTAVLSLVFPEGVGERVFEVRALPPRRDP